MFLDPFMDSLIIECSVQFFFIFFNKLRKNHSSGSLGTSPIGWELFWELESFLGPSTS
jgi:hypothetical protein